MKNEREQRVLAVIGGGVAGVTLVEEAIRVASLAKEETGVSCGFDAISLVSASSTLKGIANVLRIAETLETFDVVERPLDSFRDQFGGRVSVLRALVTKVDIDARTISYVDVAADGECGNEKKVLRFHKLAICSGAVPKSIDPTNPLVKCVRDDTSVSDLCAALQGARRVLIVGNGGIAMELVQALRSSCQVVWAIKNRYIGNTFFDASASAFLLPELFRNCEAGAANKKQYGEAKKRVNSGKKRERVYYGNSIGAGWTQDLRKGLKPGVSSVHMETECEVSSLERGSAGKRKRRAEDEDGWPLCARLSNGKRIWCDFVVSATGVSPNIEYLRRNDGTFPVRVEESDGGIAVNRYMQAFDCNGNVLEHIYAAGDACSCSWPDHLTEDQRYGSPQSTWFQMRLWSQAKTMGAYAGRSITNFDRFIENEFGGGCNFDCFSHISKFFGLKVVLLGRYNGQGLGDAFQRVITQYEITGSAHDGTSKLKTPSGREIATTTNNAPSAYQILVRITPGKEYIKVILGADGVVKGALLIGEAADDLAETFENLILSGTDVSHLGIRMLDVDIDLEEMFD